MPREVIILFGPPGTGKTTSLMDVVDKLIYEDYGPEDMAFVSFTRQAAHVARDRAAERFGFNSEDLTHFRTLHSTAYRQLGLAPSDVMLPEDYATIAGAVGLSLSGRYSMETEHVVPGGTLGDACLRIYSLAKARQTSLEREWQLAGERELLWPTVREFVRSLEAFKRERHVLDFTDMLEMCDVPLNVGAFIIDEAQDLTLAQWDLARRLGKNTERIWIAGDDDQSLYDWAGASSSTLITLMGERRVLPHSYRLPRRVKTFADRIAHKIRGRVPKDFTARDAEGAVEWIPDPDAVNLREGGTWLLLVRHRHQIYRLTQVARQQGVVYRVNGESWSNEAPYVKAAALYERLRRGKEISTPEARLIARYIVDMQAPETREKYRWNDMPWPWGLEKQPDWMDALSRMDPSDAEYIRQLRRNGESLVKPGRVTISTIHGAKGGEADNVVLLTDVTRKTLDALQEDPDPEYRVWYVGATRAKETLYLVFPKTQKFFTMP